MSLRPHDVDDPFHAVRQNVKTHLRTDCRHRSRQEVGIPDPVFQTGTLRSIIGFACVVVRNPVILRDYPARLRVRYPICSRWDRHRHR